MSSRKWDCDYLCASFQKQEVIAVSSCDTWLKLKIQKYATEYSGYFAGH